MKQTLLFLFFFVFALSVTYSQTSFSDRLSIKPLSNKEKVELQIFPNPATDYIGVTKNDIVEQVMVFNLIGRQMKSFEATDGEKYYVGDLPRGMYLVQLLGADNQIITTQRVNKR
ncbi:MAG: T9SS type A sorting domain-containing protein [Lewinellaceae bacterium]|nr:T9SS type A sorting domain-containing protein [Lewinellaceae bacterium]